MAEFYTYNVLCADCELLSGPVECRLQGPLEKRGNPIASYSHLIDKGYTAEQITTKEITCPRNPPVEYPGQGEVFTVAD